MDQVKTDQFMNLCIEVKDFVRMKAYLFGKEVNKNG